MKITAAILLIGFLLLTIRCEEASEISLDTVDTGLIAVEAVLTNENIQHAIRLSYPYQEINGKRKPASGAVIEVRDSNNSSMMATETPPGSGIYLTPTMRAITGSQYTLKISFNGMTFTATDTSVPVEPLQPISIEEAEGMYKINFAKSGRESNYIDHQLDWTRSSSCADQRCLGQIIFYDLKNIDLNELYKPNQQVLLFPAQTIIVRKKYSVSEGYRAFLRSMLLETEWRGSVFDVIRDNAPTNLSQGAIGYFAVSTVVSDTTVMK